MNTRKSIPSDTLESSSPSAKVIIPSEKFGVDSVDYAPVHVGKEPPLIQNSVFSSSSESKSQRRKLLDDDEANNSCCCRRSKK